MTAKEFFNRQISSKVFALLAAIAFIGCSVACVSLYLHTKQAYGSGLSDSFCNINATVNCDQVLSSKYAVFAGIPLASFGLFFYLTILLFSLLPFLTKNISSGKLLDLEFFLSVVSVVVSIVLYWVSYSLIESFCLVCIFMYVVNVLLGFFSWSGGWNEGNLLKRLFSGFITLIRLPGEALGIMHSEFLKHRGDARLVCLVVLSLAGLAISLPDFVFRPLFFRENTTIEDRERNSEKKNQLESITVRTDRSIGTDYAKGTPDAPITMIEFSDFECPFCRRFYFVIEEILEKYKGKIFFVLKNYPLDRSCNSDLPREFHKSACFFAELSRCAGEQGDFWKMTDLIFRNEKIDRHSDPDEIRSSLLEQAASVGFDLIGLKECLASDRQMAIIDRDLREGRKHEISGTPTLFINGRKVHQLDRHSIEQFIENILLGGE